MTEHLPHDRPAEEALLGSVMTSDTALYQVLDVVDANDFYVEEHRIIFKQVVRQAEADEPCDLVTIRAGLEQNGLLASAGGVNGLSRLVDAFPDVANARHYATLVHGASTKRKLIAYGRKIEGLGESTMPHKEVLNAAMADLTAIAERASGDAPKPVSEFMEGVIDELEELASGNVTAVGVRTGLPNLDSKVLMRNGRVVVVAGATSSGKSSLALQIADQVACAGQTVAFFSLEMSGDELGTRILAERSKLEQRTIEAGPATPKMVEDLRLHLKKIKGMKLFIDDNPASTPLDVQARSRQIQMHHGLDLVVVDYLQLLSPGGSGSRRSREQEVASMSRALKVAARSLGVPVILLSQLSRRHLDENRKPELRDLRESGSIENDADCVLMVHRPDLTQSHTDLLVRKQRQGPLGSLALEFDGSTTRFSEVDTTGLGVYSGFNARGELPAEEEEDYDSVDGF
jgi:replicative DNA helicase